MLSRRNALTAAALAPVAITTGTTAATPDPIFAAIEAHQAAWDLVEAMVESDEDTFNALCRARGDRLAELLATTPTTVAGCAAMLRCVQAATTDSEEDSQLFSDWHERISEPAATLLGRIADALDHA